MGLTDPVICAMSLCGAKIYQAARNNLYESAHRSLAVATVTDVLHRKVLPQKIH